MAFGARELRLILSIQSYGTGNITRLRRDITSLVRTADLANMNQLRTTDRAAKMQNRMLATGRRLAGLDAQLAKARGINALERRAKLVAQLPQSITRHYVTMGKALAGDERTLAKVGETERAILQEIRAIDLTEANIVKKREMELRQLGLQQAAVDDILGTELAISKALDAQAVKMAKLQRKELIGRGIAHFGRTAQFAGLIGLAVSTGTAAAFARFNTQVTLAATQLRKFGETAADIPKYTQELTHGLDKGGQHFQGILELMSQFPASADDMAKSAYDIASSMDVNDAGTLKLLKLFNQLAVATGSDLPTATSAGITVLNDFGGTVANAGAQLNLMMSIIRFGRMRLNDLNDMLTKVAPAALAAGQNLKDVAGAMVLITRVQPSQRVGATGIARLLQTFRDPDFQRGIFAISKGTVDITKGKGAVGVLKPLPVIIDKLAHSVGLFMAHGGPQQLFKELTAVGRGTGIGRQSRIEAANAFTFLIKFNERYQKLQKRTTGDTNEFTNALKAMSQAPGVQWAVFVNGMKAFAITLGEVVLPELLKLAGWLTRAAHWFEGLSNGIKTTTGKLIVWGSAIALVGGTVLNLAGSFYALSANMRIAAGSMMTAEGAATRASIAMTALGAAANILLGIGLIAIPIVVQLIRGGNPGLWAFVAGALSGAAGGAILGGTIGTFLGGPGLGTAIGAGLGAATVTIALDLIPHFQGDKNPQTAARKAYNEYAKAWQSQFKAGGRVTGPLMSFDAWLKQHPKYLRMEQAYNKKHGKNQEDLTKIFNRNLHKQLAAVNQYGDALEKAYRAQDTHLTAAQQREKDIQKARVQAMQEAVRKQNDTIKTAVDNMVNLYDQMRQANEQVLGSFAQGPTMKGILGSIFSDLNDMLRQFGVQIPVPFAIIKKDFDQQLTYFKRWRADVAKLVKMGATPELIQQIQDAGGIPVAEGIINSPGGRKLIKSWTGVFKKGGPIEKATHVDMTNTLKYWNTFGKKAAYNMIMGITSNIHDDPKIQERFRKYVKTNFGDILHDQLMKDFHAAFKDAMATIPKVAGTATGKIGGRGGGGAGGGGRHGGRGVALFPIDRVNRAIARERGTIRALGAAAVSVSGPGGTVITGAEQGRLQRHQDALARLLIRRQRIHAREVRSVQRQLRAGRAVGIGEHLAHPPTTTEIHYHGDTYNVKSSMTADQFFRHVRSAQWRKRHKRH